MALGKRIKSRLDDLGWSQNDLLEKVDGLTKQALSNLIKRDSKRSEWDEKIALALGVSVLWLVYGDDKKDANVVTLAANEQRAAYGPIGELVKTAELLSDAGINQLIGMAKVLAREHPRAKPNLAN